MLQLFTDTSANLPVALTKQHHITVVPFSYTVDGKETDYPDDVDFDGAAFYGAMRRGAVVKTSMVNPALMANYFERALSQGDDVLYVGMSGGISGTAQAAVIAAGELTEKYPARKIVTIDTYAASLGEGLQVLEAARMIEEGKSLDEIKAHLLSRRPHMCQFFTVDDLAYLKRGGRISGATALIGTVLSINPAATRLLEITPNCLGADFGVANRNPAISALVEKALTGEKAEENVALTGGEYLAAASPVKSDGAVSGVVLLLFDVTQKQKAEALRREFTANVSHELKTPLHAISGYAELMKDGLVPPEDTRHFGEKIYSEAQRMIDLVEDTLRLSRLDEGAADMQWAPIDLYETAKSAMQELTAPAELKNVSIRLEGTKTVIQGIPQLVSGIVFNLMDNAVKYNKDGGLVIVRLGQEKKQAVLTVTDTGIGIRPEHQERVFERFYRVDKSHSKEIGGTGLGLSIVKHGAQVHHAQIAMQSALGEGTTITLTFPAQSSGKK